MKNSSITLKFIHLFWYVVFAVSFSALVLAAVGGRVALHISSDIRVPLNAIDYWTRMGLYAFFAVLISGVFLLSSIVTNKPAKRRK